MGYAEVISLPEVRARKQWEALRQQLHERFDQWLDAVEARLPASAPTLAQVTETIWALRQQLTGGVAQTIVEHTHHEEQRRTSLPCATCTHRLRARPQVSRTVETLIGEIEVHRPYFYCRHCHRGGYPLDQVLELCAGRLQRDVQQAAADVVTEIPYDTASTLFGRLSGLAMSSERMHTLTNQAAEGLTVLDVAPSREEIEQRVAVAGSGPLAPPGAGARD